MKLFKSFITKTFVISVVFSLISFNLSLVKADGIDVTPPVIKSVSFTPKIARPGDVIEVTVEATDSESGFPNGPNVDCGDIRFQSKLHDNVSLTEYSREGLYYNPLTGRIHAKIIVPKNARNGDYYICVVLSDRFDNSIIETYPNKIITIISGSDDYAPPKIKSLTYYPNKVKPGDLVKITVTAEDKGSGIPNELEISQVDFLDVVAGKYALLNGYVPIILLYDDVKDVFEGSFTVSPMVHSGVYVPHVFISDKLGNRSDQAFPSQKITVTGGKMDTTPPFIKSITYSKKNLMPKDIVKISVLADDLESGILETFASISFSNKAHKGFKNPFLIQGAILSFDPKTKMFVGEFQVPVNIPSGEYMPEIYIQDNDLNYLSTYMEHDILNIGSFITYVNDPVPLNTKFDPLQGVKAISSYEGDISSKIECSGEIDTSIVGLNLFKYAIRGKDNDVYEDFRWVMVSDSVYTVVNGTLFTNQKIDIFVSEETGENLVLESGEFTQVVKDGSVSISEEGYYTVSIEDKTALKINTPDDPMCVTMPKYLASPGSSEGYKSLQGRLRICIEKTPPTINGLPYKSKIQGSVTPTTELPCTATLNGMLFKLGTTISSPGNYTLKVTDRAGNVQTAKFTLLSGSNNAPGNSISVQKHESTGEILIEAIENSSVASDSTDTISYDEIKESGSISMAERDNASTPKEGVNFIPLLVIAVMIGAVFAGVYYLKKKNKQ